MNISEISSKLNLKKPIVFIKACTTGINPYNDRIVELSMIKIIPGDNQEIIEGTRRFNPGINIHDKATAIHGITNEDVSNEPFFYQAVNNIYNFIDGCDLAGFNIGFDLKMLSAEFARCNIPLLIFNRNIIDALHIFQKMDTRNFESACKRFTKKNISSIGLSSIDYVKHCIEIFNGMIEEYKNEEVNDEKSGCNFKVTSNVEDLSNFFNYGIKALDLSGNILLNKDKRPVFAKGIHKNKLVSDVVLQYPSYYYWFMEESTMPYDTKIVVKMIFEKAKNNINNG